MFGYPNILGGRKVVVSRRPNTRPVNDDDRNEILIPVISGVQELLFDPNGLFRDRPGFIAGPTPDTGIAQAVQGIARFNCRSWALSPKSDYSLRVNQGNAELCGPYLDDLGERPDDGFVGTPFEGGQCPAVYVVTLRRVNEVTGPGNPFSRRTLGPIGGVRRVVFEEGNPPNYQLQLFSSGPLTASANCGSVQNQGPAWRSIGTGVGDDIEIVSITPCGSDDCGDPPSVVQPPGTVTPVSPLPPSVTINLPGIGPVDITLTLNPNGDPVVCIPEIDVCVTVEPPDDITGGGDDGGDGGPSDGPPGDIGSPGAPEETGEDGTAQGCAGDGEVLVGIKVDIVEFPERAKEYAPGVYRAVCYAYLGTLGNLDHDPAGAMLRNGQFIFAEKDNLTCWRVDANAGYNLSVTPYYRSVEE